MGAGCHKVTKVLDDTVLPGIGLRCQVDGEKKKKMPEVPREDSHLEASSTFTASVDD